MRKDFRKAGFPECLTPAIRNAILEKANAHLARSSERIYWDDSGNLNIEY